MAKAEVLLTSTAVAHILDVSPDEVLDLARKGRLKGEKGRRFWRFRMADVTDFRKNTGLRKKEGSA